MLAVYSLWSLGCEQADFLMYKVFFIFDAPPRLDAVGGKVRELSSALSASSDAAGAALSEAELAPGGVLDALLSRCAGRTHTPAVPCTYCVCHVGKCMSLGSMAFLGSTKTFTAVTPHKKVFVEFGALCMPVTRVGRPASFLAQA